MEDFGQFCLFWVVLIIGVFPWITGVITCINWLSAHVQII